LPQALLSAAFAALTAIFAKVCVENVDSDLATFIRTVVIITVLGTILAARGLFQPLVNFPREPTSSLACPVLPLHAVRLGMAFGLCHALR